MYVDIDSYIQKIPEPKTLATCDVCGCEIYQDEIVIETLDQKIIHEDCLFDYLSELGRTFRKMTIDEAIREGIA